MSKYPKTINWNSKKIKTELKKEITSLNRKILSNNKPSFPEIRKNYKYIWCTLGYQIIPIQDLADTHLISVLKLLFKDIRSKEFEFNAQPSNKSPKHAWWHKESQLYTWAHLRTQYKIASTLIAEAKQRNLWTGLLIDMEIEWPIWELKQIKLHVQNKESSAQRYAEVIVNKKQNTLMLSM